VADHGTTTTTLLLLSHRSLYLTNKEVSIFDLTKSMSVTAEIWAHTAQGVVVHGDNPLDIVEVLTTETVRRQDRI